MHMDLKINVFKAVVGKTSKRHSGSCFTAWQHSLVRNLVTLADANFTASKHPGTVFKAVCFGHSEVVIG